MSRTNSALTSSRSRKPTDFVCPILSQKKKLWDISERSESFTSRSVKVKKLLQRSPPTPKNVCVGVYCKDGSNNVKKAEVYNISTGHYQSSSGLLGRKNYIALLAAIQLLFHSALQ